MRSVRNYANYRKFLLDYYGAMQKKDPEFSYRKFAKQVKHANASFLNNIMHGRRKPEIRTIISIAAATGMDEQETRYFANLVELNHAASAPVRQYFQNELQFIRSCGNILKYRKKKK